MSRLLISYPIPFDGDRLGTLRVPKDITREEAERVKAMIDALVLPADSQPEDDAADIAAEGIENSWREDGERGNDRT